MLERLTQQKLPEQQATLNDAGGSGSQWSSVFVYNDYGKLTDGYDARGVHTAISYDGLNRPLQVSYPNDPANTPTVTYTYDESRAGYYNAGRLTTLATALAGSTPATTQVYNYNQMGYVAGSQEIIGSASYSFSYAYNLLGELTAETYPTSRTVNYSYDRVAHLNTISDVSRTYDTIGVTDYDARGALKHETFGNGAERIITYGNNRMQPDSVKLWISGIEQEHIDYSYGTVNQTTGSVDTTQNTGQIGKVAIYVGGSNTKLAEQRFSYDSLGRLQTASEYDANGSQSYSITYTFDRYGNRFVAGGQTSAFSYVAVTGADIDATTNRFTTSANINYDYAGNITSDAKFTNLQYTLDANNRQRSARTLSSSPVMTSVYDGAGQRVQTSTSATRNYVYDAFGALAAEYVNGSLDREYVYRGGEAMCIIEASGALKYLFTDLAGTPRVVMDGSAAIVSRHDYAPFGEDLLAGVSNRTTSQGYNQTDNVRQSYSGMEKDSATSLQHTQWRKYGNTQGRWTSVDPYSGSMSLGEPQSMNRYAYVQNDPVNFTDRLGLGLGLDPGPYVSTTIDVFASLFDPLLDATVSGGFSDLFTVVLQQEQLPSDLKERVLDKAKNCADLLNNFFDALSKIAGKPSSTNIGTLFDSAKSISLQSADFFARIGAAKGAGAFKDGKVYVKDFPQYSTATGSRLEFRYNAMANVVLAELIHLAGNAGGKDRYSDPKLDEAALRVMTPADRKQAEAEMKRKGYTPGTVGHRLVTSNCQSTNPSGPPPSGGK